MCILLLPPGVYPIAFKYIVSYHIISYHIISYHIISYHIISYHIISYHISYHIICVEKKNQPNATQWFIALIIRSTCFGHFYAHHQEIETICVLLPPMVCSAEMLHDSVVQHLSSWTHSLLPCTWPLTASNQALHTIGGNNTHLVLSS